MKIPEVVEIYVAANSLEAHAVRNLLEAEGIEAQVVGEALEQGAFPAGGRLSPRVWVHGNDAARARELIEEWEGHREHATEPIE